MPIGMSTMEESHIPVNTLVTPLFGKFLSEGIYILNSTKKAIAKISGEPSPLRIIEPSGAKSMMNITTHAKDKCDFSMPFYPVLSHHVGF